MKADRRPGHGARSLAGVLAATGLLAACSSVAPTRFHSLLPPLTAATATGAAAVVTTPRWILMSVAVPVQADMPQLVVRQGDGTLILLEHDRWLAPLADEIRSAVALHLAQALAQPDTARPSARATALPSAQATSLPAAPEGAAPETPQPNAADRLWQVALDVLRMDSVPDRYTALEVEWSFRPADGGSSGAAGLRCRAVYEQAVAAGVPALAAGHRAALARLGDALAWQLRALAAGNAPSCDASAGR